MKTLSEILKTDKPVLVDFSAAWCAPCKMLEPILDQLEKKVKGSAEIVKIDIDQNPLLATVYSIRGVPTLILFVNGEMKWRQSGVLPLELLEQVISTYGSAETSTNALNKMTKN